MDAAWSRAEVHGRAERLAALEAATRAVAAELDIDRVLGVIVDRVRELVGARFAALGIADGRGRIERFITSGITPGGSGRDRPVPRGHGLLGLDHPRGPDGPRGGHRAAPRRVRASRPTTR